MAGAPTVYEAAVPFCVMVTLAAGIKIDEIIINVKVNGTAYPIETTSDWNQAIDPALARLNFAQWRLKPDFEENCKEPSLASNSREQAAAAVKILRSPFCLFMLGYDLPQAIVGQFLLGKKFFQI